jgi:hypothetical protein
LPLFWFFAGVLCTLACILLMLPWLRTMPRLNTLPAIWAAGICVLMAALLGSYRWLGHPDPSAATSPASPNTAGAPSAFASAAGAFADATRTPGPPTPAASGAASMSSAIASLEKRLAKGTGTADDWELLAKSYEFLGRPDDAGKARARQLPPLPPQGNETGLVSGTSVSGEVSLAAALSTKASAGATLFIVAKSVDSPGAPVAVFRGSVGDWPVKFTLDDSQSMLPGRNLSSAGRVTIEARISQNGQPLPAAGDLQGSTGTIDPADHRPLKILIDRIIT